MSIALQFDVDQRAVRKMAEDFPRILTYEIDAACEEWLRDLVEYAKAHKTWRDQTGRLSDSLNRSDVIVKNDKLDYSLVVDVRKEGADKNYALFMEYGTTKMAPRPFMRPAVDAMKDRLNELLEDAKNMAIRTVAKQSSVRRTYYSMTKTGDFVQVKPAPEGRGAKWRETGTGRFATKPTY